MRSADVYVHEKLAGRLWENEEGYHFQYLEKYVNDLTPEVVSKSFTWKTCVSLPSG